MDKQFSDEQLDQIAKNLLRDFSLDAETVDEIAESPKLWWNLRNEIAAEKSRREKRWFFGFGWQKLAFPAIAFAVCFGLLGWILVANREGNSPDAKIMASAEPVIEKEIINLPINENPVSVEKTRTNPVPQKTSVKPLPIKTLVQQNAGKNEANDKPKVVQIALKQTPKLVKKQTVQESVEEETKTDFIALSYASNSEGGQIVRVKVPRSMMVSLGVSDNVAKNEELVNAEVIVNDDGSTRAIRFISKR